VELAGRDCYCSAILRESEIIIPQRKEAVSGSFPNGRLPAEEGGSLREGLHWRTIFSESEIISPHRNAAVSCSSSILASIGMHSLSIFFFGLVEGIVVTV
jgi:hypothetical protein